MPRDHPNLVQHLRYHTQGWRANGDISLILSKSGPSTPSVNDIVATEKYITGYACKGNQPTGAVADLFSDMVNSGNDNQSAKSIVRKLLIGTIKRDVSAVEASYELSSLPLYRSSHSFQSVSLSGFRAVDKNGITLTKSNIIDKYLNREESFNTSLDSFISRNGRVPVISGNSTQATWPLTEDYCRSILLLHYPNWRKIWVVL